MKTSIFYFSSTGNSLKVAKDIAAMLSETQIFAIPKLNYYWLKAGRFL
jgi:flavodoxin